MLMLMLLLFSFFSVFYQASSPVLSSHACDCTFEPLLLHLHHYLNRVFAFSSFAYSQVHIHLMSFLNHNYILKFPLPLHQGNHSKKHFLRLSHHFLACHCLLMGHYSQTFSFEWQKMVHGSIHLSSRKGNNHTLYNLIHFKFRVFLQKPKLQGL